MTHNHHESLPGYEPGQIWYDGCEECEQRAARLPESIGDLDGEQFRAAWQRAGELQTDGIPDASEAELGLLRTLAMVQVQLERHRGYPLGVLP